ncbi:hypothetical protein Sjap_024446 [Stephania japonica]|uniref:Uncharacterized protein n=1 Tax=Stephania japonica TaxID=461633 RepID=A0AAP0EM24_9MAGN
MASALTAQGKWKLSNGNRDDLAMLQELNSQRVGAMARALDDQGKGNGEVLDIALALVFEHKETEVNIESKEIKRQG